MDAIDYLRFLDPDHLAAATGMTSASTRTRELYSNRSGIFYDYGIDDKRAIQEAVWFNDDLLLLFGSVAPFVSATQNQVVREGDWVHIQFQVKGGGIETVGEAPATNIEANSFTISRYPSGSLISRAGKESHLWRAACLYFRPALMNRMFGDLVELKDKRWTWLSDQEGVHAYSMEFPLTGLELIALNGIFECPLRGDLRRSYLQAKSAELLTLAVSHLARSSEAPVPLSNADRQRISWARNILVEEIDARLTLSQIARRVGVNRSKLAMGFKSLYGTSVQSYWRELKLCHARELLMTDQRSVTEVAASVGYSDISCLTRAFEKRFGILPKDCKLKKSKITN